MTDLLIRGVSEEDVARIDARARREGLSRNEYLRRRLVRDARSGRPVAPADLERFAERFGDLADPAVMRDAWS